MTYLYLFSFIAGLLLAVRLMFFGAERRRLVPGALPLRRSEPALVTFLLMFGGTGYLVARSSALGTMSAAGLAAGVALVVAALGTWLAVAAARLQPEHDPEDPRYVLQGRVAIVTVDIPSGGEGIIRYEDAGGFQTIPARDIGNVSIASGQEVCIERVEGGVAYVELWALVEERL